MVIKHLEISKIESFDSDLPVFRITNIYSGWNMRFGVYETKYLLQALHAEELAEALQLDLDLKDELPDSIKKQLDHKFEEWELLHSKAEHRKVRHGRAMPIYKRMKLFFHK